jgi:hypothetical protein
MVRKQVFITPEQWGRLKAHAAAAGVSMAEIIRRGIERELEQPLPSAIEGDWKEAWRRAFGMWADRDDLDELYARLRTRRRKRRQGTRKLTRAG